MLRKLPFSLEAGHVLDQDNNYCDRKRGAKEEEKIK